MIKFCVQSEISLSCTLHVESLTKLDTDQKLLASNYSGGDKTGQSWTDKVMNVRETVPNTSQEVEGVAEDEWVGGACSSMAALSSLMSASVSSCFFHYLYLG